MEAWAVLTAKIKHCKIWPHNKNQPVIIINISKLCQQQMSEDELFLIVASYTTMKNEHWTQILFVISCLVAILTVISSF